MVASDTVVGLVGAGILLVALVGVFAYESRAGQGGTADLMTQQYILSSTGNAKAFSTTTGGTTPMGTTQCVPQPTPCVPPHSTVDLTISGLPDSHGAAYVAFLKGNADSINVGALQKTGTKYAVNNQNVAGGSRPTLIVTLEASGSAAQPTTPPILSWDGINSAGKDLTFSGNKTIVMTTGKHSLTFTPQGGNINATATIGGVPTVTGFAYRAWMVNEKGGESFAFIGNFTVKTGNGTVGGEAKGAKNDYTRFIVTLEPTSKFSMTSPSGPIVIAANYNPLPSSTGPKP